MARKLIVEIIGDASSFQRAVGKTDRAASSLTGSIGRLSLSFGQLVKGVVIVDAVQAAIEGLSKAVHLGTEEFKDNQRVQAQTFAVLKSTGGIANVTARHIDDLGLSLSNLSGIDDELVRAGENVLLSFTNIRDFAGKGNQIFTEATKTVVDFAARTGRDVPAAALILGRALEDPARRVASLSRAGIVFSASQQKMLKAVENTKGVLAAQKVLLAELQKRYGGAAKAAGETLSGQLNVLRDRFKDLAGSGIGLIAPAVATAVKALTGFVRKLSEAKGADAKFHVTVRALTDLGDAIKAQVDRIDFGAIASRIGEKLRSIDWAAVIGRAGKAVGDAFVTALNTLHRAVESVNWQAVGQDIVKGVAIAIGVVVKFLASVNWGKVAKALARTLAAALRAALTVVVGVAGELGRLVVNALGDGLRAAGGALEKVAIRVVLKIVEPFTHIPSALGKPFRLLKTTLEAELADLGKSAGAQAKAVGEAISGGISTGVQDGFGSIQQTTQKAVQQATRGGKGLQPRPLPEPPAAPVIKRKGITASQRNTFFDNSLSRLLNRVQDAPIKAQIAKLQGVAGLITARIAATKDVTRRLNLEDKLLDVTRQIKGVRDQLAQNFLDALQLHVDKAGATKSMSDDLAALGALQAGIRARIKSVGMTLDLERQLSDVQQQISQVRQQQQQGLTDLLSFKVTKAEATAGLSDDLKALQRFQASLRKQIKTEGATLDLQQQVFDAQQQITAKRIEIRNAKQFKALGLTAAGDDLVPGIGALQKQLRKTGAALEGSFLDTTKTRSLISHLKRVLSGGLGEVGSVVKAKVKQMLDDLDNQLKSRQGDVTKFRHVSTANLLKGLGLDQAQMRALKYRIAPVGPGGSIPARGPAFALAGGATAATARTVVAASAIAKPAAKPTVKPAIVKPTVKPVPVVRKPAVTPLPVTRKPLAASAPVTRKPIVKPVTVGVKVAVKPIVVTRKPVAASATSVVHRVPRPRPVPAVSVPTVRIPRVRHPAPSASTQRNRQTVPATGGNHYHIDNLHINRPIGNPRDLEDQLEKRTRSRAHTRRGT